jgi:uncharacterized protein YbaR (Trm112 family)
MHKSVSKLLVCPICNGKLEYRGIKNELLCLNDNISFPVRNGVPILLEMDANILKNYEK